MMPKFIKPAEKDREFELGAIRLVRIKSTLYLYIKGFVHPKMTQKCGDDTTAKNLFYQMKMSLNHIYDAGVRLFKKRSPTQRLRDWFSFNFS